MTQNMKKWSAALLLLLGLVGAEALYAAPSISGGAWFNYRYVDGDDRDGESFGDVADEALILYIDDQPDQGPWSFSGEMRFGPGSFTDTSNNSTGDNFVLHKAWVNYRASEALNVKIGKSQVPFGWKTANFWPGDMFQAGYGDQMDVGIKLEGVGGAWRYALAYYHADDWGETSTDTTDDNRHWGSATTYRKVQTVVGDLSVDAAEGQNLGISLQAGRLQDLTGTEADDPVDGTHQAAAVYYHGTFDAWYLKGEGILMRRELPENYASAAGIDESVETVRGAFEAGYHLGDWFVYGDVTWADTSTSGNDADAIIAYTPGISYDYGPGWFYLEYLTQDGWIDRNGDINEGDFAALYLTVDYYF